MCIMNFSSLLTPSFLLAGFTAFILTFVLVLLALWLFPKLKLMDRPERYGLTRKAIPYYGGIMMFVSFLICVFLFIPLTKPFIGVLLALALIVGMSFADDRWMLSPKFRLLGQVFAGLIVVAFGIGIRSFTNPFGGVILLDQIQFHVFGSEILVLGAIFTILWIVFVMNSMNFFDGVPGLLSGVSCLAFFVLCLLSLRTGQVIDQTQLVYMSLILAGIAGAFLVFDFPTPKILMGDTGSMFLGFLLAVSAIFSGGKVATVLIVLGFPLLDALWSIMRRVLSGQSPFKGDLNHLHHRFLKSGYSERQVVLIMYSVSAFFGGLALFLTSFQKMIAIGAIVFSMILLSILLFFRRKRSSV